MSGAATVCHAGSIVPVKYSVGTVFFTRTDKDIPKFYEIMKINPKTVTVRELPFRFVGRRRKDLDLECNVREILEPTPEDPEHPENPKYVAPKLGRYMEGVGIFKMGNYLLRRIAHGGIGSQHKEVVNPCCSV